MTNTKNINTTALAYIGDAVYEIYIRKYCIEGGQHNVDALHKRAVKFVRADGQALAIKTMMKEEFLTEEEVSLVKRARNHKSASKPKNADPVAYKLATAFEALLGFLHLEGNSGRLDEIVDRAIAIIEEGEK